MTDEKLIIEAAEIIKNAKNIVVFTGAGISTESGIDDFRSPGGLWSRYDPNIYASYHYFVRDPSKFWQMHRELENIVVDADPNAAHIGIAKLEEMEKVKAVITQNIDMLHQKAGSGTNGAKIFQLHGEYGKLHCIECNREFLYDEVDTKSGKYPICECGGFIKPKVVLFGESLPPGVLDGAMKACYDCDCFIMVGSSLLISPANFMPSIAREHGAKVIFVNRESTYMDNLADIFLKGSAGEIFTELIRQIEK